ncbi:MAG: redoxin domain-containing protein [Planctomycetaceae bacterium]|nr:redoxin domain-containing protein [Planctomycetaceae bacterium]
MLRKVSGGLSLFGCLVLTSATANAQVDAKAVLGIRPAQADVEIDTPTEAEVPQCKLDAEKTDDGSAWVLFSPQGQVLRKFLDTNADNKVDQFRYFQHGLEVYRDYDTNGDDKVDESRWMNTAGSRWGVDQNADGKIDAWKRISAEEASREAVKALVAGDAKILSAVLLNPQDAQQLGLTSATAQQLLERVSDPAQKLAAARSAGKFITPQTRWMRFDSSMLMPNLIPRESGKAKTDLVVYENVMAIVDTNGSNGFIQLGEMIQVGSNWKLTQIPQPMDGDRLEVADAGLLLQQTADVAGAMTTGISPKIQELIEKLQKLDAGAPNAAQATPELASYNAQRAAILGELAAASDAPDDRSMWLRQQIEWIATCTQMGTYVNGEKELARFESALKSSPADKDLLSFVVFQRMLSEYNRALQAADATERQKIQEDWLKSLEGFAQQYPESSNAPDALLQLALTQEFNGNLAEAQKWYQTAATKHGNSQAGTRAKGALRRLSLKGQPLQLAGQQFGGQQQIDTRAYQGKVLAVIFWATWCKPCTEDLPQIQELHRVYQREGFEVLGVNLDAPGAPIQQYITQHKVAWPHIHEEGALESRPAVEFGIISLPTMFLIDRKGAVVSANSSVDELKKLVPDLLKAR